MPHGAIGCKRDLAVAYLAIRPGVLVPLWVRSFVLIADLVDTLRALETAKVDLLLDQQAIDTATPAGRMFFHITGAFAEFERDMIRSRVKAGLAKARARGVRLGRPKVSTKVENAIRERLAAGNGMLKTATALGAGSGVVQRVKAGMLQRTEMPVRL